MKILYNFTQGGINEFLSDTIDDVLDNANYNNIVVSVGDRRIEIPMFPETYESLTEFLKNTHTRYIEEYEEETKQ